MLFFTRLHFQGSHTRRIAAGPLRSSGSSEGSEGRHPAATTRAPARRHGLERAGLFPERPRRHDEPVVDDGGRPRPETAHAPRRLRRPRRRSPKAASLPGRGRHAHARPRGGRDRASAITLASDFDQTREKLGDEAHGLADLRALSPNGDRVALTARGKVFVAPAVQGRFIEVTRKTACATATRGSCRTARVFALSDESGEVEFWRTRRTAWAAGQLTKDGAVLRWNGQPSPDGKRSPTTTRINGSGSMISRSGPTRRSRNSPTTTSKTSPGRRIAVAGVRRPRGQHDAAGHAPRRGGWPGARHVGPVRLQPGLEQRTEVVYFLSNRNLQTVVPGPWGLYQPEPFFDKKTKLYLPLAVRAALPVRAEGRLH